MHAARLSFESRRIRLSACVAVAFGASSASFVAGAAVTSCDDGGGFDTLRHAVLIADPGGTIDMSGLQCSTITLVSGAIAVSVPDLTIKGPGQAALTVDAHGASRVFT